MTTPDPQTWPEIMWRLEDLSWDNLWGLLVIASETSELYECAEAVA